MIHIRFQTFHRPSLGVARMYKDCFLSARNNFGKFIHQFKSEIKIHIRKLERIIIKLYQQNLSLLLNQPY